MLAPNPGPMTLEGTNTWVLQSPDGDQRVIVDPGPIENGHVDALADLGPIALIVLTHGHFDHSEAAPLLHERSGAPIVARDPSLCVDAAPLSEETGRTSVAGLEWLTVLTPGHSSDSVSFVLEADRALITGDTVLGRGTAVVAHPDGRLAEYLDSLRRLRDLAAGDIDVVLPGHGPVIDRPLEVMEFYLSHRQERLDQVRTAIAAGATDADEVVQRVYVDVDRSLWPYAKSSVLAQLDYLRDGG
jgi:glyoxylase-like metal-dependent hydrolase (beta-lactamase superfamily II)